MVGGQTSAVNVYLEYLPLFRVAKLTRRTVEAEFESPPHASLTSSPAMPEFARICNIDLVHPGSPGVILIIIN
jgi:hypothetical protein